MKRESRTERAQRVLTAIHTQDETAEMLGLTRQTVAYIESRAFAKIRKALAKSYNIHSYAEAIG